MATQRILTVQMLLFKINKFLLS
uniref:Uncharacterized protein n=1 Tax=Arundo donax TaxID=35708 RepID=A0A0A8Z4F4_ARUDO